MCFVDAWLLTSRSACRRWNIIFHVLENHHHALAPVSLVFPLFSVWKLLLFLDATTRILFVIYFLLSWSRDKSMPSDLTARCFSWHEFRLMSRYVALLSIRISILLLPSDSKCVNCSPGAASWWQWLWAQSVSHLTPRSSWEHERSSCIRRKENETPKARVSSCFSFGYFLLHFVRTISGAEAVRRREEMEVACKRRWKVEWNGKKKSLSLLFWRLFRHSSDCCFVFFASDFLLLFPFLTLKFNERTVELVLWLSETLFSSIILLFLWFFFSIRLVFPLSLLPA